MQTSRSNERLLALCALITKEKDPDKFMLLVQKLNNAFEERECGVEKSQSTPPLRRARASVISRQA
jgi:hypothetical protein